MRSSTAAPSSDLTVPLRILNVVRYPIGGIRNYLRYTYSKLDPALYGATVVTVDRPEARLLPPGMKPLNVDLRVVSEKRAFWGLALQTNNLLRTGRYALIHSQGTTAAIVSSLNRFSGIPHVVTLHETFRAEQFTGASGSVKRRLLGRVLSNADAVVTVSADARANLLEHIPFSKRAARRVDIIRNGVSVDMLLRDALETRPNLRVSLSIADDTVLLGYVGRFMPEKGFDVLLEAAARLRGSSGLPRFCIVAVNDGAFVREYQQQVIERNLAESFCFVGFQSSVAGTLMELDAVVMPSRREACPLVAMEAMVLGCPLIASDCLGLRELTADTPSLRSIAGDPDSLAGAIAGFLRNHQVLRAQADAFTDSARNAFDSRRAADSLLEVFRRVLASTGFGEAGRG